MDEGREAVLVGKSERRVVLVGPADGQFERAASVEAGRARVGVCSSLGSGGCVEDCYPLVLEEGELAQLTPPRT